MSSIYLHIPFCKQACYYCNFHFATSLRHKDEMAAALQKETVLQKNYLTGETVETIYFGGGTPSLLPVDDLATQLGVIRDHFIISNHPEITLEANPDDITEEKLAAWKKSGINRLSIGVQSFFDEDLQWMNRAHNARQAYDNLQMATRYFDNISIDLIYGTPQLTNEKWKKNVDQALDFNIGHLSCYALTVEPRTALDKMIKTNQSANIDPDLQSEQFMLLMEWMRKAGYEHYEISNFAKPGLRSRHNTAYWSIRAMGGGKKYLGLGPSAHSFNGSARQWNVSNNALYIASINEGAVPFEKEELTPTQQGNEYIMTSLRTSEGLNLDFFDKQRSDQLIAAAQVYIDSGKLLRENSFLQLTDAGKLLADGIAATLFF